MEKTGMLFWGIYPNTMEPAILWKESIHWTCWKYKTQIHACYLYVCMCNVCKAAWNKFNNKQSGLYRKLGWFYLNTFHSSGGGGCGGVMDNLWPPLM